MISSWKDFFIAVEQMRTCQKEYMLTKGYSAFILARRCEAAVDACIESKRTEWAQQTQLELFGGKK